MWLWQSLLMLQPPPFAQPLHGPPQSGPVSDPFCAPSVQFGTWQMLPVQM
jgi:hypothetical protein